MNSKKEDQLRLRISNLKTLELDLKEEIVDLRECLIQIHNALGDPELKKSQSDIVELCQNLMCFADIDRGEAFNKRIDEEALEYQSRWEKRHGREWPNPSRKEHTPNQSGDDNSE
jgi:hypothetical protein